MQSSGPVKPDRCAGRPFPWRHVLERRPLHADEDYLLASIRFFVDAVHLRRPSSSLCVSGHDLHQALEVAIACKLSAKEGNRSWRPLEKPLPDSATARVPLEASEERR